MMGSSVFYGIGDEVLVSLFFGIAVTIAAAFYSFKWHESYMQRARENFSATQNRSGTIYNSDQCPICLGPPLLPVETNCGHKFCGSCINSFLQNRQPSELNIFLSCPPCPMCRQGMNILLLSFTQSELNCNELRTARTNIENMVFEYNIRYGDGPRNLWSYIHDFPVLFRHLLQEFFSIGGLILMVRVRVILCVIAAVLYILIPLDIVPEGVYGFIGLLDDTFVVFLLAMYVTIIYRRSVVSRGEVNSET